MLRRLGDARVGALINGEVPLARKLGVSVYRDAAGHGELPREITSRRQSCPGAQLTLPDGSAQLSFDLLSERSFVAAIDGEKQLHGTARLTAGTNWSHRLRHYWIFSWSQLSGKITPMNAPAAITITPIRVADLLAESERMPVNVHIIDHPEARVLVDTGMTELHPAVADMDPRLQPLNEQNFDLDSIDIVVSTHLHYDHCGGNHLFAGKPIYVQRRELDDARSEENYTIREWVDAPGLQYLPVDGEHQLLPGLRLVPAPGHTPGMQVVVVESGGRRVVVGGDVAVCFGELDEPTTDGQLRVRALDPEMVWLAHEDEPWRPRTG
jgi:N-acyl homoserine lactone hydrolase